MKIKSTLPCLTALFLVFAANSASADMLTFDLNSEFSGAVAPTGTPPWLRATFDDGGTAGTVDLTLEALSLSGVEHVKIWDFNVAESLGLTTSNITQNTGPTAGFSVMQNSFKADGDGFFDIQFTFANGTFVSGSTATFTFTLANLVASSFDVFSSTTGSGGASSGGAGPFRTAAHVGGIAIDDPDDPTGGSGWVTETDIIDPQDPIVPEPSSWLLLAVGGCLVGACRWRRRSR